ncbi:MAG: sugar ABC transporter substrate-binding protein [Planctomycetaceae bacterium]|nr:sugar ABC transporter substrate-binding protein [Planctomycetaceae bacterium]
MKTKRGIGMAAMAFFMAFSLAMGIGAREAHAASGEIAFLPMTLDNEFYVAMKNGAEEACKKLGYTLVAQSGTGHGSASEQLQLMETMIQKDVEAILITPCSSTGIISGIKKANSAGIPVIILDTEVDQDKLAEAGAETLAYLGSDNYKGGQVAGEYAKNLAKEAGKQLRTVILTGVPGQENMELRKNGFLDAAGESVVVVAEQNADSDFNKGNDVMTNILTANPDVDFVYSCNDLMAMGAYRAARAAGKRDIKIVGFDGNSDALTSIQNGELTGSVAQVPAAMGLQGVELADKHLKGESVPKVTYTEVRVIDAGNVADFVQYVNKYSGK